MSVPALWLLIALCAVGVLSFFIAVVRRDRHRQDAEHRAARVSRETVEELASDHAVEAAGVLKSARRVRRNAERTHRWLSSELDRVVGRER